MNLWIDTGRLARAQSLFGVPSLERLRRTMRATQPGDSIVVSGPHAKPGDWSGARIDGDDAPLGRRLRKALQEATSTVVAVDASDVIDPRLIQHLAGLPGGVVAERGEGDRRAVALALDASMADSMPDEARDLREVADALLGSGQARPLDEARFPSYIPKLRRHLPYSIDGVDSPATRRALERRMFWDNYKGSTDLLTAHVYPPLVWILVRLSARFGIHPNVLTVLSIILAFAAVPLWCDGQWLAGFACAYGMSVLDSVDGKVARLTLTDSRIGNLLDHGLDQVHPPFWYYAWAIGLGAQSSGDTLFQAMIVFIGFYVADRLVLRVAKRRLKYALHASTPLDTRVRSIIARRNITMSVMAIALLLGAGEVGYYLVTAWQVLTCGWHASRTLYLGYLVPGYRRTEAP